ncbi:MAG: RNA ligase family protein [Candidatus Woesearchaeota archaeon]|jgi:hypothetical protein
MIIKDMPKLESPFIREIINGDYVVTDKITEGCEWVFEGDEKDVLCTEKLNGTDVSIIIENGKITRIFNRTNEIPFFNKGHSFIIEAILKSYERGYCDFTDGQYFGEVCGPKLNGNPLQLTEHLWIPFNSYVREHLSYKSFHKYPKTFENLKKWLLSPIEDGGIFSLYLKKRGIDGKPEGVVFHNLKTGQMCKLRIDMFSDFKGKRHGE